MITLKTVRYKPEDYKFIQLAFRNDMDAIFSCHCLEADCENCKYKRAFGDIIRLLDYCQKENR